MTLISDIRNDPRRRNLAILAGAALVSVLLAFLGLSYQASLTGRHEKPELFLPGLEPRLNQVTRIHIRSKTGIVDIVFKPEKAWVVENKDEYPASHDQVHATLVGLATLMALEKKTARPDWLSYLDLVSPEQGGDGKEFTLTDEKGDVLASVITGKSTDIGDPTGAIGLYVRHPGDTQSWLARSFVEPKSDLGDWLDKQVMTVDRARIAKADVDPVSGPSYVVKREKPSDADFTLVELPKGREISYPGAPDGVAAAVVDFSFDDVKPAKNFDFSDPAHTARVVTKTFDGLTVTVNVIQQGQDYWATVSAEGLGADAKSEARMIDAKASGWAYKLPAYKGQQFLTPLESLLKPKNAPAASATAAH